jgi:hypothetical protein
MLRARVLHLVAGALAAFGVWGCSGYHVVRTDSNLGPVRRVAVQTLENHSFEPGIEVIVSDALRREFQRGGVGRRGPGRRICASARSQTYERAASRRRVRVEYWWRCGLRHGEACDGNVMGSTPTRSASGNST